MTGTLLVIQFILAALITVVVLLQKSSSIGLGAYSGSNESVFGAKGASGFLTKVTFIISILFVINTVALAYFYSSAKKSSVLDDVKVEIPAKESQVPSAPSIPAPPALPSSN